MKKHFTITYAHSTSVYKQITAEAPEAQINRYAQNYAIKNGLMGLTAIIREVA